MKRSRREVQREVAQSSVSRFARAEPPAASSSSITPAGQTADARGSRRTSSSTTAGAPGGGGAGGGAASSSSSLEPQESWPGPFSTARAMIAQRDDAKKARLAAISCAQDGGWDGGADCEPADIYDEILQNLRWTPSSSSSADALAKQAKRAASAPHSLEDLCISRLTELFDSVEDLGELPEEVRFKLITRLSVQRRLSSLALRLCLGHSLPLALNLPECSGISEDELGSVLRRYKEGELTSLCLFNCGGCFTDRTAATLDSAAPALEVLRLTGTYKLSDAAIADVLSRCPRLRDLDLSASARLGAAGVRAVTSLPPLRRLSLENIPHLDAALVGGLACLTSLEELSLGGMVQLTDEAVEPVLRALGGSLRRLCLHGCTSLGDDTLHSIAQHCRVLRDLDIGLLNATADGLNALFRVVDASEGVDGVSEGASMGNIERLNTRGLRALTDEHLIAHVRAGGGSLQSLTISSCSSVSGKTLVALVRHCRRIEELDVSFDRGVKEDALGAFVEASPSLKTLAVWGCPQLSAAFYHTCSRDGLDIVGFLLK